MKQISLIALITIMFSVAIFSQPMLEVIGGDTYDWGDVTPADSPLKAKVKIKNAGKEELIINRVKPTCGCTTAPLGKDHLKPGEITELEITLRVSQTSGSVHKTINIYSNDPKDNGTYVYQLKALMVQPIVVLPRNFIMFNDLTVGFKSTSSVKLKNTTDKTIKLSDFRVTPENMIINLSGEISVKPNQEIELTATIMPSKEGNLNASIKMKTNNKDVPAININGYGRIKESSIFNSK